MFLYKTFAYDHTVFGNAFDTEAHCRDAGKAMIEMSKQRPQIPDRTIEFACTHIDHVAKREPKP